MKKDENGNDTTVRYIPFPSNEKSAEPFLFTDKSNLVYLSWVESVSDSTILKFSSLQDDQWSDPATIASGKTWFVNWADYPMIAADESTGFLAHVLDKSGEGTYAYDVKMFASSNGQSWNSFILNDDGKQAEHGFVSMLPYDGNFFVTWLDGRNTMIEAINESDHHEEHQGAMSLRAAIITPEGKKIGEWELDDRVCDCCQTTAALTRNGPVVLYRDRSEEEIRDISIVRLVEGEWTVPASVTKDQWKIAGCPVNGPRSYAIGNKLVLAWFSAPEGKSQVNVVFSEDGGATFGEPVRIDSGNPIGRVDVVLLDEDRAAVSWMEEEKIKMIVVSNNGEKQPTITIATSSKSRSSGFPQMTKGDDELIFAWTDEKEKSIKVAGIKLSDL